MWASCPASPAHAGPVLDADFEGRSASFPQAPAPTVEGMLRVVLAPAGSAPGADNEPYELYHVGALFVAMLLGQALLAMAIGDSALACVAGPALDLLLWIPKKAAAESTNDMQPLQLPPCFRRLIGAALASLVGPIVEPHLSPRQAAIRGGYCGPNVSLAFRHLAGGDCGGSPGSRGAWDGLLGGVGPPLWEYACSVVDSLTWSLRTSPRPVSACPMPGLRRCCGDGMCRGGWCVACWTRLFAGGACLSARATW